ncbi:MAG: asparaginase [Clostridiales bacterium]|nr:asparaginase [Clostridiales bacterium]MDY3747657.1 asparaginase [Lachnospiraceae bacterium]
MKKILLIATGGTIASKSTDEGLVPKMFSAEILQHVPSVFDLCEVEQIQLMNIDSTNMEPKHWVAIAEAICKNYDRYDGFVVLHGTDTMSYTAAALSYLIQNSPKPIVLTGAQRPIDKEITDAKLNLYDSFLYACDEESCGVVIVFDGHVICGTRSRKSRTKSFNAFSSINFPDIAQIRNNKIIRYIRDYVPGQKPVFYHRLCDRVFVFKLIPGMKPTVLKYLQKDYDALIIESFGVGGVPCDAHDSFTREIRHWIDAGKCLVMATQVPYEGSDMGIYEVGMRVKEKYELLEAYDMTLESTVTKLMWILGQTQEFERIKEMFYMSVNHDLLI